MRRALGYEEAAKKIQDLFLAGKRDEAVAAVPDKLVDEVALVGPRERIADRVAAWKDSPVKTMLIGTRQSRLSARSPSCSCSRCAKPRAIVLSDEIRR